MLDRNDGRMDEELFRMAAQETISVPDSLNQKLDAIMEELPDNTRWHMNWKKTILLTAALVATLSFTVTAAAGALQQRMEALNHEKLEEYFVQIQEARIGNDNYNRPFTETEKERMEELMASYEEQALFPEGELVLLEQTADYKGKGIAFYAKTGTFFFPEKEMSDEQLLQIIDFRQKRDYSLAKINAMVEAEEIELPQVSEEIPEAASEKELVIPYAGDLEINFMAAGRNCIFLAGYNEVHKMEIGSDTSTLFFDDFGEQETRILSLCQDKQGDVYLGVWKRYEGAHDTWKIAIWVVSEKGEFLREIDLSAYASDESSGILGQMAIDEEGYLYVRFSGKLSSEKGKDSVLLVLDKEGKQVTEIDTGTYDCNRLGGLCLGKDGRIYTQIQSREGDKQIQGIAAVNREKGCLSDCYIGIVPEDTIMLDIVAPGTDTDFVFWGFDGIFTYNLGEESAIHFLPAYEAPCQWEGVLNCALPDGRIVFGACSEYRQEVREDGTERFYRIPEKVCFYVIRTSS